jgi:ABC-type glycerol-3-phosphate transport system substrate-binding protein
MLAAGGAAAAWLLAGPVAARAASGGSAPRPTVATTTFPLSFEPLNSGLWTPQGSKLVMGALWDALAPWRASHRSVDLQMLPFGGDTTVTDLVTGTAPDVILGWQNFGQLVSQGLLLDVSPYLKLSNRSLDVWPPYAVDAYRWQGGLYAFPFYVATTCMVVNEEVLDQIGQPYPSPTATFAEWAALWGAATRKGSSPRYGGSIKSTVNGIAQAYFRGWGGSIMDPADPTRCTLGSTACIEAGNAIFPLLSEGVCTLNYGISDCITGVESQKYASAVLWNAALAVTSLDLALAKMPKWNFYPMPVMPQGSFAHTQYDYRAVNAATKYPEPAWELLEWLSFEPAFQRTLMQYGLEPPALKSLQEEYTATLAAVIPPFAHKNLSVITQYILQNGAIMEPIFPADEAQVQALIGTGEQAIIDGKYSVTEGLTRLAAQVTAIEVEGSQSAAAAVAAARAFPTVGPAVARVPAGV